MKPDGSADTAGEIKDIKGLEVSEEEQHEDINYVNDKVDVGADNVAGYSSNIQRFMTVTYWKTRWRDGHRSNTDTCRT